MFVLINSRVERRRVGRCVCLVVSGVEKKGINGLSYWGIHLDRRIYVGSVRIAEGSSFICGFDI